MFQLPEERAARAVASYLWSGNLETLQAAIASHVVEAVADERRGLRTTLRLCTEVLDQALALPGVAGHLRAAVRACRGLCLAGLGGEGGGPPAHETPLGTGAPASP
ncbi:MAG: hypothetical protein L0Z62_01205 [Gemmataceae bacterium]|nr:hypothetical protein [Gemmataceae bacterium]